MASPFRGHPRNSRDYSMDFPSPPLHNKVYTIPEPVTPPANQLTSKYTPGHRLSFPTKTTLASPVDTFGAQFQSSPLGMPLQSHLATPHTPLTHISAPSMQTTPSVWAGLDQQFPMQFHTRSYSYTPQDIVPHRLSLSNLVEQRPRAYSLTYDQQLATTTSTSSTTTTPTSSSSSSSQAVNSAFPPPLSSPLSPDQFGAVRTSYLHVDDLKQRKSRRSSSNSSIDFLLASASGSAGISRSASASSLKENADLLTLTNDQILALCHDQRGCRYLQRRLSEADTLIANRVFDATNQHIVSLMKDPFGNYFCQKLFEHCTPTQVTTLLQVSHTQLPSVAVSQHGTRALQKLIDAITTKEQVSLLVNALDGHVVTLIRDLNGNHVIQKLLVTLSLGGAQFIYDAACRSIVEIGSHRHGCCVLQRCLDYANEPNRIQLVEHIVERTLELVCDPFGNYVCQYVIQLGVQSYTDQMVERMLGQICSLSVQKFSSNVVEKCFKAASPMLQNKLLMEIMEPSTFNELVMDNYGNYVIQTALESTKQLNAELKRELSASIQASLVATKSPYGRRILTKLKAW